MVITNDESATIPNNEEFEVPSAAERKKQKTSFGHPKAKKTPNTTKTAHLKEQQKPNYHLFYDKAISDYVIREVKPYFITFETYAKGRWLGRRLLDILSVEYGGFPIEYWANAIKNGFVKVNGSNITTDYVIKNADLVYHKAHRHEPMVYGQIQLVGETDQLLAVNKPASIPMHSCGSYNYNSLEMILKNEPIIPNQPSFFLVHRLDRLTSGLIVLAKDKDTASKVAKEIREKTTEKIYLARVKGKFPSRIDKLKRWETVDLAPYLEDYEKNLRKEQKRVESSNPAKNEKSESSSNNKKKRKFENEDNSKSGGNCVEEEEEEDERGGGLAPGVVRRVESFEEVIQSPLTGYMTASVNDETPRNQLYRSLFPHADPLEFWVSCSLDVISYREGIHSCCTDGKPSLSRFRCVGYDEESDTSLIECKPFTGRTHQLRLHLWLCGNPIANDPCYGGELFYRNQVRRETAIHAMKVLEQNLHHRPLSKMPHVHQITNKEDELLLALQRNEERRIEMEKLAALQIQKQASEEDGGKVYSLEPLPDETEEEFLLRTCKNCREDAELVRLEHAVHCDGIWLHALCYAGKDWMFETAFPDWALSFSQSAISSHVHTAETESTPSNVITEQI